ncbi:hypothetical protein SS50377_27867 [Spironucleus salmonicida]|uniref:Uncharacterized protein n=1 Tax=Spironucleus salmonicida TaxID=348837 RepID=V6LW11_9EUKA|nr:hypothetical protein SS50377_27867 [Spironucleus salmonicida]|eukprot:EST48817.1 Hypothetical protein SS50377_10912 [Spironucleus salmonicida]
MKNQLIAAAQAAEQGDFAPIKSLRAQITSKALLSALFQTIFSSQMPLAALFHGLTTIIDTLQTSLFSAAFCIDFEPNFASFYRQTRLAIRALEASPSAFAKPITREFAKITALLSLKTEQIATFFTSFFTCDFDLLILNELLIIIYQKCDFNSFSDLLFTSFSLIAQHFTPKFSALLAKIVFGNSLNGRALPPPKVARALLLLAEKSDFLEEIFRDFAQNRALAACLSSIFCERADAQFAAFARKLHVLSVTALEGGALESAHLLVLQARHFGNAVLNCGVEGAFHGILMRFDAALFGAGAPMEHFLEFCCFLQKYFLRVKTQLQMYNNNIVNFELEYLLDNVRICVTILNEVFRKPAVLQLVDYSVREFWHIVVQISLFSEDFILDAFLDQFTLMIVNESDFVVNMKFIINICFLDLFIENGAHLVKLIRYFFEQIVGFLDDVQVLCLGVEAFYRIMSDPETLELAQFNLPEAFIGTMLQIHRILVDEAEKCQLVKWQEEFFEDNVNEYDVERICLFRSIEQVNNLLCACSECEDQDLLQLLSEKALLYTPVDNLVKIVAKIDLSNVISNNMLFSVIMRQNGVIYENQLALPINEFYLQNTLYQIQYDFQHDLAGLYFKIYDMLLTPQNAEFLLNSLFDIAPKFVFNTEKSLIDSFSTKFSAQNLKILAEKLENLYKILSPQQQQEHNFQLFQIIYLVLDSSTSTNEFSDVLFDNQNAKSTLDCQEILFPFLEENFFFSGLNQILQTHQYALALDLLTFTIQMPPRSVHLKIAVQFLAKLVQNCLSAPLRGKDCISERELGIVLSKTDNPLEIIFQGYDDFCLSSELEVDREGLENQIMSRIEINEFERCCSIIFGDIIREVIEEVKRFVFK